MQLLFLLKPLKLLVEQLRLFQLGSQVLATELETPVQADEKRAKSHNNQRLEEIAPREPVGVYNFAEYKMPIETYHECDKRGVDELEPQVATNYIIHPTFKGAWSFEQVNQYCLGENA
jgi:hypothetical protein